MPVSSLGCSKGDSVPLRYAPGSGETGSDNPLSSARRTRPRRRKVNCPFGAREGALGYGAGRGVKVRQSWTFTGNFMRRTAVRLSCLFCRRQNAAGDCALCARKARRWRAFLIAFAAQTHKKSGRAPDFLYSQRKKVSARELSDVRVLRSQNTDCRKNEVFRQA